MIVRKIRFTVISPLNYYYIQAGRGLRPSPFIGDIALKYALLHGLGMHILPNPGKTKPTYEELAEYRFWFTVAMPPFHSTGNGESGPSLMHAIYRNTMQGIDYNGTNAHPKIRTGSIMYKNFYFQQPIKPGSQFYAFFLSEEEIILPEALRVGTGRVGCLKLEELQSSFEMHGYINLYTIQNILGKRKTSENLMNRDFQFREHMSLPYYILGPIDPPSLEEVYFGNH